MALGWEGIAVNIVLKKVNVNKQGVALVRF